MRVQGTGYRGDISGEGRMREHSSATAQRGGAMSEHTSTGGGCLITTSLCRSALRLSGCEEVSMRLPGMVIAG